MALLPTFQAEHLNGDAITFPTQKECFLILGFDKLQYTTLCDWYAELNDKTSADIYIVPFISDRFMLMKDVLFDGIVHFFSDYKNATCPAFVNRIRFFGETGLDENAAVIIHVLDNGEYAIHTSLDDVIKIL